MKKKVLVIGGAGDIGSSIVNTFNETYTVKSTSRKELDLSSDNSISLFLNSNKTNYDHIIFCAADNNPEEFVKTTYKNLEKSIKINFLSFTEIIHFLLKNNQINEGGSIIVISSLYSYFGRYKRFPYSVSKHALFGVIKNLALELSSRKIRVNSISPGFINTKLTRKNLNIEDIKRIEKNIPSGNIGNPEDIANIALFLSSSSGSYINGQDIIADGGYSCGGFMGIE